MIFLIIFNAQKWDNLLFDNVTPEISLGLWKPLIWEKIKLLGWPLGAPDKLINNVILPARWCQMSF